jgi:hypothetical protein
MSDLAKLGDGWAILPADPLTGQLLEESERAFRERILGEAQEGLVGVDTLYLSARRRIHQPLADEQGQMSGDGWILERANNTTLRVAYGDGMEPAALAEAAVTIARAAINDFAAEVMLTLFAIANDPPNWRRPQLTISLNDLLDRLGFTRDNRGVHRSDARKKLSTTLLSLHLLHIGVQQRTKRRGAQSVGFLAPLLSGIAYATNEETSHISPIEVFRQGLPETVSIHINPLWYSGVRHTDGSPGLAYSLVPRAELPQTNGRTRGGSRSPAMRQLREYLLQYRRATGPEQTSVTLTRMALLSIVGITNRRADQANASLVRAIAGMVEEELLDGYRPDPLPIDALGLITLHWAAA